MKKIILLLTFFFFSIVNLNAEEKKVLPDDCYAEYKVSPDTLGCKLKKGFKNLYTKDDGSLNALGKFFNAKSFADVMK